jgi:hypothetical protein
VAHGFERAPDGGDDVGDRARRVRDALAAAAAVSFERTGLGPASGALRAIQVRLWSPM